MALGAAGARVAVNYSSDREGAERAAQAIADNGGKAIAVGADVSKAADVARLFKEGIPSSEGWTFWSTMPGYSASGPSRRSPKRASPALQHQRSRGDSHRAGGDQAVWDRRREHHQPHSIVGSHPVAGALLYASTKRRHRNATRGLALELAPRKIRVNAIAPGHTETEGNVAAGTFEGGAGAVLAGKTPLGRLGRVTDIRPLAVFLASDESAWITGRSFVPQAVSL